MRLRRHSADAASPSFGGCGFAIIRRMRLRHHSVDAASPQGSFIGLYLTADKLLRRR
jgi:hypothetical protein